MPTERPTSDSPAPRARSRGNPALRALRKAGTLLNVTLPFRAALNRSNRNLLRLTTQRNILSRYKGSAIGLVWTFIQPLVMLAVYAFVFGAIFKSRWEGPVGAKDGSFVVIMFFGMTLYSIFSECVSACCTEITGHPNYVKKVVFPLEILPVARLWTVLALNLPWFALLFLGAALYLGTLSWTMLLLPLILLPLLQLTLGLAYFVASLGVYVRDTQHVVGILLRILWFLTPIFYPVSRVPERFQRVLQANPLTVLVEQGRRVFLYGQTPEWIPLLVVIAVSALVLQLGFIWFCRTKEGFADVL